MPVEEASYRGWDGQARATYLVVFAIAGAMIKRLFRFRLVRFLVIGFPLGASLLSSFIFGMVYEGEGDFRLAMVMRQGGLSTEDVLSMVNRISLGYIGFFAILLAALVGAPLIAEDRRAHALPLYFSRPIGHLEYVVGKFLTLAFYLGLLCIAPPVSMYLLDIGYSDAEGAAWDRLPILLHSLVPAIAQVTVLSAVALGVSSMAKRASYAALLYFGLMMIAFVMAQMLSKQIFDDPDWLALSPSMCVRRIAIEMLPVGSDLRVENRMISGIGYGVAWTSLAIWTGAGLALLTARIRRVEVVS